MVNLNGKYIFRDANGQGYLIKTDSLDFNAIHELVVRQALKECDYNQKETGKRLGISHRAVNYYVKKYGIKFKYWYRNH